MQCPYYQATDNSKNEKHGDSGRAANKADKQIELLEEKLATATGTEKQRIKQKIKNIKEAAQRAAKGEEHGRRGR